MQYDEPMPHLQDEVVDVLAQLQAPAMQPVGRCVDQWTAYFADRSIADLRTQRNINDEIRCCSDGITRS